MGSYIVNSIRFDTPPPSFLKEGLYIYPAGWPGELKVPLLFFFWNFDLISICFPELSKKKKVNFDFFIYLFQFCGKAKKKKGKTRSSQSTFSYVSYRLPPTLKISTIRRFSKREQKLKINDNIKERTSDNWWWNPPEKKWNRDDPSPHHLNKNKNKKTKMWWSFFFWGEVFFLIGYALKMLKSTPGYCVDWPFFY
jgi:hypothetical protein